MFGLFCSIKLLGDYTDSIENILMVEDSDNKTREGLNYRQLEAMKAYFPGLNNVRIVPQSSQEWERERKFVHYPLAKLIAEGHLASISPSFKRFAKNSLLVLCNFRLPVPIELKKKRGWKDKRPDIICLTKAGDVLVVECKEKSQLKIKREIDRSIKTFITLKDFAEEVKSIKAEKEIMVDAWDKWEILYNERYNKHKFPDLRETLSYLFKINNEKSRVTWAQKVMENITSNNLKYGFAINGSFDERREIRLNINIQSLFGQNNHDAIKKIISLYNSVRPYLFIVDSSHCRINISVL